MAAMGSTFWQVSHDLHSPLSPIIDRASFRGLGQLGLTLMLCCPAHFRIGACVELNPTSP